MKIEIYKGQKKNFDGAYIGQLDFDETQIQVFALTRKERNRLVDEIKKIIKPTKEPQK